MRPKVVRARGFLYYPVRRAASSAIQLALGYDFLDWRAYTAGYESFHRFTCYRNTFDRLASLYYNFVNPAPQGRSDFSLGFHKVPDFDEWISAVCRTQDATCDEHLHSQDWHTVVPTITIYDFSERQRIFKMLGKEVEQLGAQTPTLPEFSPPMLRQVEKRYGLEILFRGYLPRSTH